MVTTQVLLSHIAKVNISKEIKKSSVIVCVCVYVCDRYGFKVVLQLIQGCAVKAWEEAASTIFVDTSGVWISFSDRKTPPVSYPVPHPSVSINSIETIGLFWRNHCNSAVAQYLHVVVPEAKKLDKDSVHDNSFCCFMFRRGQHELLQSSKFTT